MKLSYIHHSSFLIERENFYIVFDYYKKSVPKMDEQKRLYVLCSHSHGDHYNDEIFEIFKYMKDVVYIFSDDIEVDREEILEKYGVDVDLLNVFYIGENSTMSMEDFDIETLKSTDLGVAFILNFKDYSIYFAGDLNWWTWVGYETEEEYNAMTEAFKREINKIKGRKFKLAMLPLDHRQGERFDWGMKFFIENTNIEYVAPMHLWNKFSMIEKFKDKNPDIASRVSIIQTDDISDAPMEIK